MDPRDFDHASAAAAAPARISLTPTATTYTLTISMTVDDLDTLWQAAAAQALACPGMTFDDVVDVIGPPDHPSVRDCLLMLADPARFPGCDMHDLALEEQRVPAALVAAALAA